MDAVLGTAGHIDHGKTSLVAALTGINCDRLDEEKRRGITIELGFAWLDLPDGRRLGIVDVPGHERFVKNMVAGAAGIDCVLLVIAADEGVMPQTQEHLEICSLLGIRHGIVALTKTDMVEPDWLELVREDVKGALQGTFLENAPLLNVSSATGEGLAELRAAVQKLVNSLSQQRKPDILRLPVDRVFTLRGYGTIVTGTIVSGLCRQGDEVCLVPSGKNARARSLQVHGNGVKEAHSGQRCAINLQGLDVDDISRGDVVSHIGALFPSRRWLVRLSCLQSAPLPLRQRMEVHFHHGAAECSARVVLLEGTELKPGETGLAELLFGEPMAGIFGDRFVLRAHAPLRTIAGGVVIDPLPEILRKRNPDYAFRMERLRQLANLAATGQGEARELLELALDLRAVPGADLAHLAALSGIHADNIRKGLEELEAIGKAVCWNPETGAWIGRDKFEQSLEALRKRAQELHEREPLKSVFAQAAFCAGWGEGLPQRYLQKVVEAAVERGILEQDGGALRLAGRRVALSPEQRELAGRIETAFGPGQLAPPALKEFCEASGCDPRLATTLAGHLCEQGTLVKIQEGLYYNAAALALVREKIVEWFADHEGLEVGDLKTMLDISRKYAIPLLEYFDAGRLTLRVGNIRKLRGK